MIQVQIEDVIDRASLKRQPYGFTPVAPDGLGVSRSGPQARPYGFESFEDALVGGSSCMHCEGVESFAESREQFVELSDEMPLRIMHRQGESNLRHEYTVQWIRITSRLGLAHLGEYGASWDEGSFAERKRVDDPGLGRGDGLLHLHRLQDEE